MLTKKQLFVCQNNRVLVAEDLRGVLISDLSSFARLSSLQLQGNAIGGTMPVLPSLIRVL
jgi:hypothetical protein